MTTRLAFAVTALLAASSVARANKPDDLSPRARGDLAIHARAILKKHCYECHGGPKTRSTLSILEHNKLVDTRNPVPFVSPKNVAGSQIIHFIEDGSMPPGSRPRLKPEEIDALKQWIAASSPRFPAAFDDASTLQTILDDLATHPADAEYLRYFSFAHLIREDTALPDLKKAVPDLYHALAAAGVDPREMPQEVDDTATLFRFDVRFGANKVGWANRDLFSTPGGGIHQVLSVYDVLLLEYPHGSMVDKRFDDYLTKAKLVRPIPFLRADWVTRVLLNGKVKLPLADDLKSLTELSVALADGKEDKIPLGPKTRAFDGQDPVQPAAKPEPRLPILPFSAWYSGDVHVDPPPFTLTAELIDEKGIGLKSVQTGQPFKLRVNTKPNVRFTLLMVHADGAVRVDPTRQNTIFAQAQTDLTPMGSDSFRITDIITGQPKATEYFVLLASESLLPPVTIVRSRHKPSAFGGDEKPENFPINRFLFDLETKSANFDPAKFDPTKVIRKVIPIPLTTRVKD